MSDLERDYWALDAALGTADGTIEVVAPFDRSPIARVETAGEDAVEAALRRAQERYEDRSSWLSVPERIAVLEALHGLLGQHRELLAREAAREGGKPLRDSQVEVARAMDCAQICIEELRTRPGVMIPMGITASSAQRMAYTRPEPMGPVVAVSAFNHPLNLIAHQVLPAVAVGAPVIVKPAKATPLSCLRLLALLEEAGLPPGWATALIPRDNALATRMVADPRVAFFSFIGSAKVGFSLQRQLAPGARSALEHGGVAPVVVCADADLDRLVLELWGDGSLPPNEAISEAAKLIHQYLAIFFDFTEREEREKEAVDQAVSVRVKALDYRIEDLDFSVRTYNCLKKEGIETLGALVEQSEADLMAIRNFGKRSLTEVVEKLAQFDLALNEPAGSADEESFDDTELALAESETDE